MNNKEVKNKKIIILYILLSLVIISLIVIYIYDYVRGKNTDKQINTAIDEFTQTIDDRNLTTEHGELEEMSPEVKEKTINLSGYNVLGTIKIDKINIKYPIIEGNTKEALRVTVCKIAGNNVNDIGNLCLAGHNMRNGKMFTKIKDLIIGDIIELTDRTGNTLQYTVTDNFIVEETEISVLDQTIDKRVLTLITCTNDGKKRVIVKAKEI